MTVYMSRTANGIPGLFYHGGTLVKLTEEQAKNFEYISNLCLDKGYDLESFREV